MTGGAAAKVAVRVDRVAHSYGSHAVLAEISLDIMDGEFVTLLGQSGSGKTTLLRIVAGLIRPTAGAISIAGRDVTHLPVQHRGVGFVFQNYALFPHLTIYENVAYPLRIRHVEKAEIDRRVQAALARIHLPDVGSRLPSQLSGGQQQRVAVARALVYEPSVLLMDEPLGALDRKLRRHMQFELRQLHLDLGLTCIFVTHDQEEALTMSDRVVVMDQGRILQADTPVGVYNRPASGVVADFVGSTNFLDCKVDRATDRGVTLRTEGGTELGFPARPGLAAGQHVRLAVRPEHVRIAPSADAEAGIAALVKGMAFMGSYFDVTCALDTGEELIAQCHASEGETLSVGQRVSLQWDPGEFHIFADEGA